MRRRKQGYADARPARPPPRRTARPRRPRPRRSTPPAPRPEPRHGPGPAHPASTAHDAANGWGSGPDAGAGWGHGSPADAVEPHGDAPAARSRWRPIKPTGCAAAAGVDVLSSSWTDSDTGGAPRASVPRASSSMRLRELREATPRISICPHLNRPSGTLRASIRDFADYLSGAPLHPVSPTGFAKLSISLHCGCRGFTRCFSDEPTRT
jgi:hypothetical protein